jgi:hypothetical protein
VGIVVFIVVVAICCFFVSSLFNKKRDRGARETSTEAKLKLNEKDTASMRDNLVPATIGEPRIIEAERSTHAIQKTPAFSKIPPHRLRLLFISGGIPRGHGYGVQISVSISPSGDVKMSNEEPDDPSTIYSTLPIREPTALNSIPSLPYFPSYSGMTPEQRALYLRWLCETSQPIDIGYVFVYYYGLERHLVYGEFDAAVDEIIDLRKHHNHSSFQSYSSSALVHACLVRKRPDRLESLYFSSEFSYFDNSNLLILHYSQMNISPDIMLRLAKILPGVNRRYLQAEPDLYLKVLVETLRHSFGKAEYPFANRFNLESVKGIPYPIFANISFPSEIRAPALPNILRHAPFQQELGNFFREVHESVKTQLRASRQASVGKRKEKNAKTVNNTATAIMPMQKK